ncbi:UDP-glucose 4-epimerase GalE [Rahnella bonaserana]|uniref:UDP-glucose 4-epimerase GalE n=1 Tax=Rahnella bonaserana TaxID=2816248 RepID=UPI003209D028
MSVLVTGGAGYIGSHTVLTLLMNDIDVIVVDNLSNSSYESLIRVEKIAKKEVKFYQCDILNTVDMEYIFSTHIIDSVIHFAGLKSVGESVIEPIKYYENNVNGTLNLAKIMIKHHVNNLIFSSSATVYGNPERIPLDESCNIGGTTNPYGYSKLVTEQMLSDIVKSTSLKTTCLRYFNPIGAHESSEIGESPQGMPNNLMPYITQVAIGKLKLLKIFGQDYPTQDGTGVRDYIHVMDLAEGHLAALKNTNNGLPFRVYNLGTGKGYSVLDLIKSFEDISGIKINFEFASRRSGDIAECWSDSKLAENELGWVAKRDLSTMIRDSWNWQKNNPNGFN